MVSEFIQNRINLAHDMIDQKGFEEAVELLKNLKNRIHEQNIIPEINIFEQEHDQKLKEMINKIDTSSDDPLRKQHNKYEQWKRYAQSYLKFYDNITKKHDI